MFVTIRRVSLTPKKIVQKVLELAQEKKAFDMTVLDMRKVTNFCDYFVICSGTSDRQARAIAKGIEEGLEEFGVDVPLKQGLTEATWVLLDLGDVVVHVFEKETREFYALEHLWQDAKVVKI